jgi:hypothetical protein
LVTTPICGDLRKPPDFSGVIHAHLEGRCLAVAGQPQNRKRHPDVVVEVAHRFSRRNPGREQVRDGVLRRRLAGAASYPHHTAAPFLARPRSQRLQGAQRIPHHQFPGKPHAPLHHQSSSMLLRGGFQEVVSVVVRPT